MGQSRVPGAWQSQNHGSTGSDCGCPGQTPNYSGRAEGFPVCLADDRCAVAGLIVQHIGNGGGIMCMVGEYHCSTNHECGSTIL